MSEGARMCPICDLITDDEMCPGDNVPTVDRARLLKYQAGLEPGSVIAGRFRVDSFLGAGAMGGVYLCTQLNMQRPVAVKSLKPEYMADQGMLKRFYLEARAASQLSHPNIVRIYDFGVDEDLDLAYIAMEYLEGDDLLDLLNRRPRLTERETCGLMAQVAKALVGAHDKGIVHRDLKPANIHVRELPGGDIQVKVLDFGIAKVLPENMDMTSGLTDTGMTLGTPHYMSPEQMAARTVDYRSDFYAVGCMVYEMLVGERPFDAEDWLSLAAKHIREPAPPLPDVLVDGAAPSEELVGLYQSLMAKRAGERPQSTDALGRVLSSLARGEVADLEPLSHAAIRLEQSDVKEDAVAEMEIGESALVDSDTVAAVGTKSLASAAVGKKSLASDTDVFLPPMGSTMHPTVGDADSTWMESQASQPRSKRLVVMGGGLLAAAALILWFAVPGGEPPPPTDEVVPVEAPATATSETPTPSEAPSAGTALVAAPVEAPTAVWIRVETNPPGARIREGKVTLGTSPVDVSLKPGQLERRLTIELASHGTEEVLITPRTQSPMRFELTPQETRKPSASIGPKRWPKSKTKSRSSNRKSPQTQAPAKPKPAIRAVEKPSEPAPRPKKKKKSEDYTDEVW